MYSLLYSMIKICVYVYIIDIYIYIERDIEGERSDGAGAAEGAAACRRSCSTASGSSPELLLPFVFIIK